MKHLVGALDHSRLRVLRRYDDVKESDEYYLLKYQDQLLYSTDIKYNFKMNKHFKRFISQDQMLSMMTSLDTDLYQGHRLYHMYKRFNDSSFKDLREAENSINEIINEFRISGVIEFMELANTLSNWKEEIINSFSSFRDRRISNGPIEGRNSLIKKVLKLANGYDSFDRFRNRIMYVLNKHSTHSFSRN